MIRENEPPQPQSKAKKQYKYRKALYQSRIRLKPHERKCNYTDSAMSLITIRTRLQVAQILGISRQAVHQIERMAIWKIRHRLAESLREDAEHDKSIRDILRHIIPSAL